MLHLLSHEDGEGGLSTLVDGFQVADVMATSHPNAFNLLNYVNIPAHASGNSKIGSITPTYSQCRVVHTLRSGETCNGKIPYTKIRWNNSDRAAFAVGHDGSRINAWYKAAKIFNSLVNSKEHLWEFQLQPGRPLSKSHRS